MRGVESSAAGGYITVCVDSVPKGRGGLTVRQLKQQAEQQDYGVAITYYNQLADDLIDTPSLSVDVVIFL